MRIENTYVEGNLTVQEYSNGVVIKARQGNGNPEDIELLEPIDPQDILQAELLLSQQEILINQKNQDEALAAILLMQVGGM